MRKLILRSGITLILLAAAAGGYHWWQQVRFVESTDNAYVEGDIAIISPRIEGYVASVAIGDNQAVRAGDVLVTIEDSDFRARVAQAEAALAGAEANLATIGSQITYQDARIAEMVAAEKSAGAELTRARQAFERNQKLVASKIIGTQEMDTITATRLKAEAEASRIAAGLVAERAQKGVLEANRIEAMARVDEAAANLRLARNDFEKTVIRAPIDGVIGNRTVRVGQFVQPGSQLLALVPSAVHVVANFKETQLEHMQPGQKVSISVDAFPSRPVTGVVESFSPASGTEFSLLPAENATGNFTKIVQRVPVRITLDPQNTMNGLLRPGLSVVVSVDTQSAGEAKLAGNSGWLFGAAQAAGE
ncbi:membrane fusion protein (multidrug efflux system) [Dongia mobilis]|uniref:Membrane fusion protein (Multidrug efflux system) n=1 Tax=Dongia mobilis TaxID=578943 RepID=A0A4R6WQW9_9PROT|nr:HlyD family secretion protein [Dongia mobilis]TDQ83992.1 membrane fusion protein (multidrug efflux system) [Dongia mobilis]